MSSRRPQKDSTWATSTLFDDNTIDDDHLARRERALKTQEEEQTLLNRTVVASKRQYLELQYERVAKQRAFIRREKRKLLLLHALLASERERFSASQSSDWFCQASFPKPQDRRVSIDVGGQLFELSAAVARKDCASLLAAFVQDDSPLDAAESGCFRVDRDWRLFRHILRFLRDGILPSDPTLLRALYVESEFWRFETLSKAIEAKNRELWHLKQNDSTSVGIKGKATKDASAWWMDPPAWWGEPARKLMTNEKATKPVKKKDAKSKSQKVSADVNSESWWNDCRYKGNNYAEILEHDKKMDSKIESGRHPLILNHTWTAQ